MDVAVRSALGASEAAARRGKVVRLWHRAWATERDLRALGQIRRRDGGRLLGGLGLLADGDPGVRERVNPYRDRRASGEFRVALALGDGAGDKIECELDGPCIDCTVEERVQARAEATGFGVVLNQANGRSRERVRSLEGLLGEGR